MEIPTPVRHLIARNLENEENMAELARYSKNFLPILAFHKETEARARSKDHKEQEKAYKVLEMCKCPSPACQHFIQSTLSSASP